MATKKKPVIEHNARLAAYGIDAKQAENFKNDGYVSIYLYETSALSLDEWQQAYFPIRPHGLETAKNSMDEAVRQGRARKIELIDL